MRVAYRRHHPSHIGDRVPDFLRDELAAGTWEQTGFEVDFPAMFDDPAVADAMGYHGRSFAADSIDIVRWYNRETKAITGSLVFSGDCEGPPDHVHGGAVAAALDDILGTMVWRSVGYSRAGIPTMQLTVKYRGPIPLRKQLRLDTKVVKWEGRKICATASLRDPCSGKLLAEGDGLFYLKKLTSPLQDTHTLVGTSNASISPSTSRTAAGGGRPMEPPRSAADATEATATPRETFPGVIPYEEALRYFGPKNPNAAENLVAFHRGDVIALQRAKL